MRSLTLALSVSVCVSSRRRRKTKDMSESRHLETGAVDSGNLQVMREAPDSGFGTEVIVSRRLQQVKDALAAETDSTKLPESHLPYGARRVGRRMCWSKEEES